MKQREQLVEWIKQACRDGASLHRACNVVAISVHSWYRWQQGDAVMADQRPLKPRPTPANKLSQEERQAVLDMCNSPRFASAPPSQIVPILADENQYIASESSMYRILHEAGQAQPRGRTVKRERVAKPTSYTATAPNQVWSWDITWLPRKVQGQYYKLYLIEDIFSRYPVGWEVHEEETGELAADLLQRSVLAQRCAMRPIVLHSDNGAPMKSYTLKAKMEALGIIGSWNRPRVSNDNPYSESLFRTMKYWPAWPRKGFATLEEARLWVKRFIDWYSHTHRHSAISFVTTAQRHAGQDKILLAKRHQVYQDAKQKHPERWSGNTRNWDWLDLVYLNPDRNSEPELCENRMAA